MRRALISQGKNELLEAAINIMKELKLEMKIIGVRKCLEEAVLDAYHVAPPHRWVNLSVPDAEFLEGVIARRAEGKVYDTAPFQESSPIKPSPYWGLAQVDSDRPLHQFYQDALNATGLARNPLGYRLLRVAWEAGRRTMPKPSGCSSCWRSLRAS